MSPKRKPRGGTNDDDRVPGAAAPEETRPDAASTEGATAPASEEEDVAVEADDGAEDDAAEAGDGAEDDAAEAGATSAALTSVDIFGRRYKITSEQEPEIARALARYVDRRMRQVSKQTGSGDALRVAVLAALNIADDYYQARRAFELREREVTQQARALAEKLREAIEPVLDRRR